MSILNNTYCSRCHEEDMKIMAKQRYDDEFKKYMIDIEKMKQGTSQDIGYNLVDRDIENKISGPFTNEKPSCINDASNSYDQLQLVIDIQKHKTDKDRQIHGQYPSTDEIYVIADLLDHADDDLKQRVTELVKTLFDCLGMVPSAKNEAVQSFIKQITTHVKKMRPKSFDGNYFR